MGRLYAEAKVLAVAKAYLRPLVDRAKIRHEPPDGVVGSRPVDGGHFGAGDAFGDDLEEAGVALRPPEPALSQARAGVTAGRVEPVAPAAMGTEEQRTGFDVFERGWGPAVSRLRRILNPGSCILYNPLY